MEVCTVISTVAAPQRSDLKLHGPFSFARLCFGGCFRMHGDPFEIPFPPPPHFFPSNFARQCVAGAMLCGLILGVEREIKQKPAGLRTILLVSVGSCIFTLNSFIFTPINGDSGRVAAQVCKIFGGSTLGVRGPRRSSNSPYVTRRSPCSLLPREP